MKCDSIKIDNLAYPQILDANRETNFSSMKTQSNQNQVVQFLCQPKGGKAYLLNALNSKSEKAFIEALHNIIDAISKDLTSESF